MFRSVKQYEVFGKCTSKIHLCNKDLIQNEQCLQFYICIFVYIYIYVTHMHVYKAHMHVYIICIICIHAKQSKWCCPTMKGAVMCRILSCNLRTHCAHCLRQVMAGCCETWSLIILSLSKAVALVSKQFNQFSSWIVEIGGQSHPQPKRCMNIYEGNSLVA